MVPRAHHVRQRQERGHQRIVLANVQNKECAIGLRNAKGLGLRAVHAVVSEEAAVKTRGLQMVVTKLARAVRIGEGHRHQVAFFQCSNTGANFFHHSDSFVPHALRAVFGPPRMVRPKIASADAGARDPNQGVGLFLDRCVGHVLNANVARSLHDCCAHFAYSFRLISAATFLTAGIVRPSHAPSSRRSCRRAFR
jgi:hypothetical protein